MKCKDCKFALPVYKTSHGEGLKQKYTCMENSNLQTKLPDDSCFRFTEDVSIEVGTHEIVYKSSNYQWLCSCGAKGVGQEEWDEHLASNTP